MKPKVLIVGGIDVDARIELMQQLIGEFQLFAAGTDKSINIAFQQAGFKYYTYPMTRGATPISDARTFLSLVRLIRRSQPDIIHSFATKPSVFARLAGRACGVPVVIGTLPGLGSLYSSEGFITCLARVIYEPLQRLACHHSDLTIFQNHTDAREFVEKRITPEQKVSVIAGSGVRTDLFDPKRFASSERERVRAELGIRGDALLVTMVSRLIRSKGVEEFGAAAQIVAEYNLNIDCLLVGPRDDDSVEGLTTQEIVQLRRSVSWVGARNDIAAILAASDLFVLPSSYREGIPRVLLEAASMGLPIITTDSPGCNEVVEHGVNGLLVPTRDADALARAILQLIGEPETRQRFGWESRKRTVARFDLSAVANQTRLIYGNLLERKCVFSDAVEMTNRD